MWFISSNIITGLALAKDSSTTFGWASVKEGKINSQEINENNIEKGVNSFIGFNYGYAFDCINCDSFFVGALLSNGNSVFTTDDGSTYTYSGWGLGVVGGYGWYFNNDISILLGIGPSFGSSSKESENLKSDKGYGKDVEDRVKRFSFQPINSTPFFAVGYSF